VRFQLGGMAAAIKAAKKLALDKGVPYFIFGDPDPKRAGYVVDTTLPPKTPHWMRAWPDGTTDSATRDHVLRRPHGVGLVRREIR
jgi:hypothetical protein